VLSFHQWAGAVLVATAISQISRARDPAG